MARPTVDRSPSGLFRMATWEGEMERGHAQLPRWYWDTAARRRQFARWVGAEAETLALQIARHLRPDTPAGAADPARALIDVLARDLEWARRVEAEPKERAA